MSFIKQKKATGTSPETPAVTTINPSDFTGTAEVVKRFTAPLPELPIEYSRGKNTYDNQPEQRLAHSWAEFWNAIDKDRGTAKHQQYICGPMKSGVHPEKDKYPQEAHYRGKGFAEDCMVLALDCDGMPATSFQPLLYLLGAYEGCSYTTSSHSDSNPHARAFVALSRAVNRSERMRVGKVFERYIAASGVVDVKFDASVYKTEQQCYLPLMGAAFHVHKGDGALDVDALLSSEYAFQKESGQGKPDSNQPVSARVAYSKLTLNSLDQHLNFIDPDSEGVWSEVANSLARVYGEAGAEHFHAYAIRSDKYDHSKNEARYDRALRELGAHPNGVGCRRLIELAKSNPDYPKDLVPQYENEDWFARDDFSNKKSEQVAPQGQQELPIKEALVEAVNKDYVWDTHGLQIYSLKTRMYVRKDGFMSNYQNQQVEVGENRSVGLGSYWMKSPQRRNVNGLALAPKEGEITSTGAFNTWRGYACSPSEGDITPFTEVFNHLLPDEIDRKFITAWLAKLIQSPEIPFKVALAIHGRMQGTGKNTIFEAVAELLHPQHWHVIGNAQLTSTFNDWQLDKVFVIGDEVSNSSSRSEADLMKRYITATENSINPKGFPALRQPNLIKYVLLSNRDEIVHIEGEDRRYYVAETIGIPLSKPIADRFYSWKKSGGLSHLLHHLLHFDASMFDPTAPAPMTIAKAGVIEAGKSGLETWVEEEVSERVAIGKRLVSASSVLHAYQQATRQLSSDKAVSNALKRAGGVKVPKQALLRSGRRIRLYSLVDHEKYQEMPDSVLGKEYEDMPLEGGF